MRWFILKILQIEGLVKMFGEVAAVDKVNLSIEEGKIFGLLGPNGAGKRDRILPAFFQNKIALRLNIIYNKV